MKNLRANFHVRSWSSRDETWVFHLCKGRCHAPITLDTGNVASYYSSVNGPEVSGMDEKVFVILRALVSCWSLRGFCHLDVAS